MLNPRSHWRSRAAWATLLAAFALPAWAESPEAGGFGRWESPLRRCALLWPEPKPRQAGAASRNGTGNETGCLKLRLDQSVQGMLRVRFINAAGGSRFASEELTFAGLLLKSDQPMRCHKGECTPSWPLRMQVHGVASRRFDARGLAAQLPSNHLAKGSCSLGPDELSCQAKGPGGQHWQANAELPGTAQASRPNTQAPIKRP